MWPVRRNHRLVAATISVAFLLALWWGLRQAWTRTESDFPSYYTAAHLVLKREPLRGFYDMPTFQQHMDALVVPSRLGGYIPQTPLTMLPFVPLARFGMDRAKQLWLLADLAFLAGTVLLLTRLTTLGLSGVLGLFLAGIGSLYTNLQLGQYYVLILFLLTLAVYLLAEGSDFSAGLVLGFVCSLKLITAPFLIYLVWRRNAKALTGMCAALVLGLIVATMLFGWADLAYYLGQILPRSAAGETLDPFNPATGTVTTLLRRLLIWEPELNPDPLLNSPVLFLFLRTMFTVSILLLSMFIFGRLKNTIASYAGFLIALIFISPNTASYTFLLLLLPTALLLQFTPARYKALLVVCYALLAVPMRPSWNWVFPKVWLLGAMFLISLIILSDRPRLRLAIATSASLSAALSLLITAVAWFSHAGEGRRHWERVAIERGAIYSSSPTPIESGVVYQSIWDGRYTLRLHRAQAERSFDIGGDAFHPSFLPAEAVIRFDSVSYGKTHRTLLDPETGTVRPASTADLGTNAWSALSPDGRWITYEEQSSVSTQIYLVDRTSPAKRRQVTVGKCNSFAPAWERDSQAIVFASDCGRGVGMPALYRARLCDIKALPAH